MNDLAAYNAVKSKLRPGDIIMLWGASPLSWAIELFSGSGPSHCQIVRQAARGDADVMVTESTIENGRNGVQAHALGLRIATYDRGGRFAALRLSDEIRAKIDWFEFYKFIGEIDGSVKYGTVDLFEYLLREVPILGHYLFQDEHKSTMVCSSLVVAVLEKCGVLRGINWTTASPQQIVEMAIYQPDPLPLLGKPKLKRFNTV
jgi:hypothetical protein